MSTSTIRRASVLLSALALAFGCEEPLTMTCPDGTAPIDGMCPEPGMDGGLEGDGGFEEDGGPHDAGPTPADAGPVGMDAGPVGVDAGPIEVDAGPPTCTTPTTWYRDVDADGYGDPSVTVESCDPVAGYVTDAGDCDDTCSACWTGAAETCDSEDNDCDGSVDEGATTRFYFDGDRDGRGDASSPVEACTAPPGHVANADDCDDSCSACWTGAAEICDSEDNDCNGRVDEGVTTRYYRDADGDGRGDPSSGTDACSAPAGYVANTDDCDDSCSVCWSGASEVCDTADNDCDGDVDEGVTRTFYRDADGDGHGNPSTSTGACTAPAGYVASRDDCNDSCATCYPGRSETCDTLDNNCNGRIDEGVETTFYRDSDGDSYGTTSTTSACTRPSGYAARGGDCDDLRPTTHPGASELCNARDDDCDGTPDETFSCIQGNAVSCSLSCGATGTGVCTSACTIPTGSACAAPATDMCDGIDSDCDGVTDELTMSLSPGRTDSPTADFDRPKTVSDGRYLYSFWAHGASVYGWRLDLDGAPIGPTQVRTTASTAYDVATSSSGALALAYVDSASGAGPVNVEILSKTTFGATRTITLPVSATYVRVLTSGIFVYVYTLEGSSIMQRIYTSTTGGLASPAVAVGRSREAFDIAGETGNNFLAYIDTDGRTLRVAQVQGPGVISSRLVHQVPIGQLLRDPVIATGWDGRSTTQLPDVMVVWAEDGLGTSDQRTRRRFLPRFSTSGAAATIQTISVVYTTPADAGRPELHMDLEYADHVWTLAEIRSAAGLSSTYGAPYVYQLFDLGGVPTLDPIGTAGPSGIYEGVSVIRFPDSVPHQDRIFLDPVGNGIMSIPLGC